MTPAQHNAQVARTLERQAALDRIYGRLSESEIGAIVVYLRARGEAEHRLAEAIERFRALSVDARQALRDAEAAGLLEGR